jgi:hypothetical protein
VRFVVFVGQWIRVSNTKRADLSAYGWPPLQPIATASAYVSRSRWTLYRAVARGELPVAGRRGRALVFRREVEPGMTGRDGDGR